MALRCCVRNTDNLAAKKNATDMFFRHMDTILKVLLMWLAKRDSLYRFPSNELSETNLFFKKFDFCFRDINNIWNERENEKPIKWNSISPIGRNNNNGSQTTSTARHVGIHITAAILSRSCVSNAQNEVSQRSSLDASRVAAVLRFWPTRFLLHTFLVCRKWTRHQ